MGDPAAWLGGVNEMLWNWYYDNRVPLDYWVVGERWERVGESAQVAAPLIGESPPVIDDKCGPGPVMCMVADMIDMPGVPDYGGAGAGSRGRGERTWWGLRKTDVKWGRYSCRNEGGSCEFVGPGKTFATLFGVREEWRIGPAPDFAIRPNPVERFPFRVDPNSRWDRLRYSPEFIDALREVQHEGR